MTDDERVAAALLHRSADGVPIAPPPMDDLMRAGRHARRRRTGAVIASTMAAVLAIGGLSGFVATRVAGAPGSRVGATQPTTSPLSGPAVLPVPAGLRLIGYHGVGIAVPRSWTVSPMDCRSDVLSVGPGCPAWGPPGATRQDPTAVAFSSGPWSKALTDRGRPSRTSDGMTVARVETYVLMRTGAGKPVFQGALLVTARDVAVVVEATSRKLVDRVLDSAFAVPQGYVSIPGHPSVPALHRLGLQSRIGSGYMGMYPEHTTLSSIPRPGSVVRQGSMVTLTLDGPTPCATASIAVQKPNTTVLTLFNSERVANVAMSVGQRLRVVVTGACASEVTVSQLEPSLLKASGKREFTAVQPGTTTLVVSVPGCSWEKPGATCLPGLATTASARVHLTR